ncbi:hypothetical protein K435DRAFT_779141, partial [Dendrothele bispora CBS 962.96]
MHLLDFVHNYETLVLMKESLETKRKTGQVSVQAITGKIKRLPAGSSIQRKELEI